MITAHSQSRTSNSDAAAERRAVVEQEFAQVLRVASARGYHGTASVTVTLQDGSIQNWRIATERMRR